MNETGVRKIHSRRCKTQTSRAACTCNGSWQAAVADSTTGRRLRRNFSTRAAAKRWRAEALSGAAHAVASAREGPTLREAGERLLDDMETGRARTRSGDPYKPSAIRSYRGALENHVYPDLGAIKQVQLDRRHVQRLIDDLLAAGFSPSTTRNTIIPIRIICRQALRDGAITRNPCTHLEVPAVRSRRDRVVAPDHAHALIAATPPADRAIWATAVYAGLRRGELMALRLTDVDLPTNQIYVQASWDRVAGPVAPKSAAGIRHVPLPTRLHGFLADHVAVCGWSEGLLFGRTRDTPFEPSSVHDRARTAWKAANLQGITLHEARHHFASAMIAAGVNAKALSTYLGHSSIQITLDRYGHLFPGSYAEAASLLDSYLDKHLNQLSE